MTWQNSVDDLNRRKALVRQMGGPEKVAQQHVKGRLSARERIDQILDKGSFREIGALAGESEYDENGGLRSFVPSSLIMGYGRIDNRTLCIMANDFTVKGGSSDSNAIMKQEYIERMALERLVPLVCLYEGGGGRITEGGERTITPINYGWPILTELMGKVPVIAANMGTAAGWIAVQVGFSHFSVMTKNSELFVAGPPLVERALGYDITKQELGNYKVHVYESGVVDNVAEDEEECFRQIKGFLSYMPQNVWQQPSCVDTGDDPERREEELISIVPEDPAKTFDIRKLLRLVLDKDSMFEYARHYGRSVVTTLGRLNGYPVAVMSNDSTWLGGAQDVPGAEKMLKFIDIADTFHVPIIYLVDVPGYMIGLDAEKTGTIRKACRVHAAMHQASVPWATVLIRRCFGVAGAGHAPYNRLDLRYSWPSGQWGSMPIAGGAMAEFRKEIESAPNPEAKQKEIEERLKRLESPLRSAEEFGPFGVEDVIDPRDTRPLLCEFVKQAWAITTTQLGPKYRLMRP